MGRHLTDYFALLSSQVICIFFSILSTAVLVRFLGPNDFGQWTMVTAAATAFHAVFISWTQGVNVRFGCEEWARCKTLQETWASRWPFLFAIIILALGLLIYQPLNWQIRVYHIQGDWWPVVLFYFISIWVQSETTSLLQITGKMVILSILPIITSLCFICYIGVVTWVNIRKNVLIIVIIGSIIISIMVWAPALFKLFHLTNSKRCLPRKDLMLQNVLFGWPLLFSFLVGYIQDWGDHLLLQAFFTSYEVGLFQAAYKVMLVIMGLSAPWTTVILPRLIIESVQDKNIARKYISKVIPTMATLWIIIIIPVITFLPMMFLWIFGGQFRDGLKYLIILLACISGSIISHSYSLLFSFNKVMPQQLFIISIMTITNIAVSLIFLILIGPIGAAIGTSISYLLGQLLYIYAQHKFMKIPMAKIILVYCLMILFGCCQAIIGVPLHRRIILGLISILLLWWVIRRYSLVDQDILNRVFTGKLEKLGQIIQKLLIVSA